MIKVTIKPLGVLKLRFGFDDLTLELAKENPRLDDLIRALVKKCKRPQLEELLLDPGSGQPSNYLITVVDGKPVKQGQSGKVPLENGSIVEFLVAVEGG